MKSIKLTKEELMAKFDYVEEDFIGIDESEVFELYSNGSIDRSDGHLWENQTDNFFDIEKIFGVAIDDEDDEDDEEILNDIAVDIADRICIQFEADEPSQDNSNYVEYADEPSQDNSNYVEYADEGLLREYISEYFYDGIFSEKYFFKILKNVKKILKKYDGWNTSSDC